MKEILFTLLEKLEKVGELNEEIYDSECREKMDDAIWNGFIVPDTKYQLSNNFGLYSNNANNIVKSAIQEYIVNASKVATDRNMSFLDRLAAFQDNSVFTSIDKNSYNDFFGYSNPEEFNSTGEWLGVNSQISPVSAYLKDETINKSCYDEINIQLSLFDIQTIIDKNN